MARGFSAATAVRLALVAILGSTTTTTLIRAQNTDGAFDCSFVGDVDVLGDGSILLRNVIHPVDETVTIELEWAGPGYLSFGFSANGMMVPAQAVIGLPNSDDVQKYDMVGKGLTDVVALATQSLTDKSIVQTDTSTILKFTQPLVDGNDPVTVVAGQAMTFIWAYGITNDFGFHAGRGTAVTTIPECVATATTATEAPTATVTETTEAPMAVPKPAPVPVPKPAPVAAPKPAPFAAVPTPQQQAPTQPPKSRTTASPQDASSTPVVAATEVPVVEATPAPVVANATKAPEEEEEEERPSNSTSSGLDCSFQGELDALGDRTLLIRQILNQAQQTVTVQMEWAGEAWLSFAWTETGKMVPATAMIGLPDDNEVLKFDIVAYDPLAAVVLSAANRQTLSDATIVQENGITILTFTKLLVEAGEIAVTPNTEMMYMWAWGSSNALGMHPRRGVGNITFTECLEIGETTAPTPAVSNQPSAAPSIPVTEAPTKYTTKAPTVSVSSNATLDCSPQGKPIDVLGDGTLMLNEFIANPVDQTVTVELAYEGEAWLSLGFSASGKMVPAIAVIGLPDSGEVLKYIMTGTLLSDVVPSTDDDQTLINATITQNDGVTILRYTKLLNEEDDIGLPVSGIIAGENPMLIWAWGNDNTLGVHPRRGNFTAKLQTCLEVGSTLTPTVTPVKTEAPTMSPTGPTGGAVQDLGNGRILRSWTLEDGRLEVTVITDAPAGTMAVDFVHLGQGYVSIAIGSSLKMLNAISIMALPGQGSDVPEKYDLGSTYDAVTLAPPDRQTLVNASMFQNDTHTGMSFTKLMVEPNEPPINILGETFFLYAMGPSNEFQIHNVKNSYAVDLSRLDDTPLDIEPSKGSPNKTLWIVHGILLALAWLILVPIGVAASVLRGLFTDKTGLWFKTHRNLNTLAVGFTFAGFAIAVYLIADEQKPAAKHFSTENHHITGLVIFLLAFLQALSGVFRPGMPHPPPKTDDDDLEKSEYSEAFVEGNDLDDLKETAKKVEKTVKDKKDDDHHHSMQKSTARVIFEYQHRILGVVTLVLSWVTCGSGVELYRGRFGGPDLMGAVWGVAAGLSIVTLILAVVQNARKF